MHLTCPLLLRLNRNCHGGRLGVFKSLDEDEVHKSADSTACWKMQKNNNHKHDGHQLATMDHISKKLFKTSIRTNWEIHCEGTSKKPSAESARYTFRRGWDRLQSRDLGHESWSQHGGASAWGCFIWKQTTGYSPAIDNEYLRMLPFTAWN